MWLLKKSQLFVLLTIFIISVIFTYELFVREGQPITFDAPTHIANIAQVHNGLKDGDIPVHWGAGWARYGWPAPLFAQQTTSYLGGLINFIVNDVVLAYHVVIFIGTFTSSYLLYVFLRYYVGMFPALLGAIVFNFAPYRIMNVYIRGALPEFFSSVFIILLLIALYQAIEMKNKNGYLLISVGIAGLLLTHPFMLVVSSILLVPYGIYLLGRNRKNLFSKLALLIFMALLGLGIASYYLLPLFFEVKYLYYGATTSHFTPGHFLSIQQFLFEKWLYFSPQDIGPRGHYHLGGLIEGFVLLVSAFWILFIVIKKKIVPKLLLLLVSVAFIYIFVTLRWSDPLYQSITLLGNIQHPWRMLTGFIVIPPILLAFMVEKLPNKRLLFVSIILLVAIFRFPQLYGKNYTSYSEEKYYVTDDNMHGTILNTVWMGEVRDYPYREKKVEIFEGEGSIAELVVNNSTRSYTVHAKTTVGIVDYTFYFPGWKIFANGIEVTPQFQDPSFRGVITYKLEPGTYDILQKFTMTKPRILGITITVGSLLALFSSGIVLKNKKYEKLL